MNSSGVIGWTMYALSLVLMVAFSWAAASEAWWSAVGFGVCVVGFAVLARMEWDQDYEMKGDSNE